MGNAAEDMQFTYELTGTGWSAGYLTIGSRHTKLTASYLGDALGELLAAVLAVADGNASARASWDEEPGEYRWVFGREDGLVHVRVLWFRELWSDDDDDAGEERLSGTVTMPALVSVMAGAARKVLDDYGASEYKRAWVEHPFPEDTLRALEAIEQAG